MTDPVLRRRARVARGAIVARRLGYACFGVAIVVFVVGMAGDLTPVQTTLMTVLLITGSLLLAPAIVLGYAVRAAEREDTRTAE